MNTWHRDLEEQIAAATTQHAERRRATIDQHVEESHFIKSHPQAQIPGCIAEDRNLPEPSRVKIERRIGIGDDNGKILAFIQSV